MKNVGKKFEEDFKKSLSQNIYYLRLKDATPFANSTNTRFTPNNPCDCILYYNRKMFMIELKTHKGTSLPHSAIRDNQLNELLGASLRGIKCYLIINFSEFNETYAVEITKYYTYKLEHTYRKSIPLSECQKIGIKVDQTLKRTRYTYNIEKALDSIIEEGLEWE